MAVGNRVLKKIVPGTEYRTGSRRWLQQQGPDGCHREHGPEDGYEVTGS
jgi:hypothetical protein